MKKIKLKICSFARRVITRLQRPETKKTALKTYVISEIAITSVACVNLLLMHSYVLAGLLAVTLGYLVYSIPAL